MIHENMGRKRRGKNMMLRKTKRVQWFVSTVDAGCSDPVNIVIDIVFIRTRAHKNDMISDVSLSVRTK